MLQIRNDFEIVEKLRKNPAHIRKLAEELKLVPSTVMRIVKRLEQEKIVDFSTQGKNKVYFLKKTPEAKKYLFMTEEYKSLKILQNTKLRMIIKELEEGTQGELIVLFGSYAKGTAKKDSDIDIYIETDNRKIREKLRTISEKLSIKMGKFDKDNLLTKEIIKNHTILQNTSRFYQLTK